MKTIAITKDQILIQQMQAIFADGVDLILAGQSFDGLIKHLQITMDPLARAMVASESASTQTPIQASPEAAADDLENEALARVARNMATALAIELWNVTPIPENKFQPRKMPRPERNAPCPCHSGLKYKQCCGIMPGFGLQHSPEEMLTLVAAKIPSNAIDALLTQNLPLSTLSLIADTWFSRTRSEDVIKLLEPSLIDLKKCDERAYAAADTLLYAYLYQQNTAQYDAFITRLKNAPDKKLRGLGWMREALALQDKGQAMAAREAYKQAEALDPNNPELAHLDILLLLGSGQFEQAQNRIDFWIRKFAHNPAVDIQQFANSLDDLITQALPGNDSLSADLPDDYPEKRLVLRIDLEGIAPPIWRRVEVENILTFSDLHFVIQTAMGWENEHLFEFEVGNYRISPSDDDFFDDQPTLPSDNVEIGQVLGRKKIFYYTYDFGDNWRHKITVEKRLPPNDELPQATLIDGERAAPPEDCGGTYGYERILEAKKHPRRAENREYSEWFRYYRPEVFKIASAQKRLKSLFD